MAAVGKSFYTGADTSMSYKPSLANDSPYFFAPGITWTPVGLAGGPVTIYVELCDCRDCEFSAGSGRCITKVYHVTYNRPPGPEFNVLPGGPGSASRGGP